MVSVLIDCPPSCHLHAQMELYESPSSCIYLSWAIALSSPTLLILPHPIGLIEKQGAGTLGSSEPHTDPLLYLLPSLQGILL